MGKHSAADDSTVHPLVADALARRAGAPAGAHGEHSRGSTGWPEPEPGGGGAVGWPGDIDPSPDEERQEPVDDPALAEAAPSRRGWRRLLGLSPAA